LTIARFSSSTESNLLGYKWEEWKLGNFGLLFAIGWC